MISPHSNKNKTLKIGIFSIFLEPGVEVETNGTHRNTTDSRERRMNFKK
jgi:hypothetical protein